MPEIDRKIDRRDFLKILGLAAVSGVLSACVPERAPRDIPFVSVEDLLANSKENLNKKIKTRGFTEFVSEDLWFKPVMGMDITSGEPTLQIVEVKDEKYRLRTNQDTQGASIDLNQRFEGASLTQLPISAAGGHVYEDAQYNIVGTFIQNNDGEYHLEAQTMEAIDPSRAKPGNPPTSR